MLTPVEELLCEGKVLNGDGWIVAHVVADHLRFKDDETHFDNIFPTLWHWAE